MSQTNEATIRRYLQMVQDSTDGNVPQAVIDTLRRDLEDLWRRIMNSPHSYVMTPLEFKLFNHFLADVQARNPRIVQRAVKRYWDSSQRDGTR